MRWLTRESPSSTQSEAAKGRSYGAMVWAQFLRDRPAMVSLFLICILFAAAVLAPVLASGKPLVMRMDGQVSSPLLRELFAPSQSPERFLERLYNYVLVLVCAGAVTVLPAWLLSGRRRWVAAAVGAAVAAGCLAPFLLVQARLDVSDYRAMAAGARSRAGNWAVFAPVPYGPFEQAGRAYMRPDSTHRMGTDNVGRDVLSRVIHGARVSLSVGFLAVAVAAIIGTLVGLFSAYHGGWVDLAVQRVVEVVICFPTFLLILTILAFVEKRSIFNVMLVIGLTGWTGIARLVRGQALVQRQSDYVVAARALGAGSWRIIMRHLLPNSIAPVLVAVSFGVAGAILTESGLSFLGFGVQPPTASWGELVNESLAWPIGYWWLTTWPGFMIFATVTLYNLVGEGIRDALDPRLKV